jgi:aspartyl-tRNA synthetase
MCIANLHKLDMEMSWAGEKEVMEEIEHLLKRIWLKMYDIKLDNFTRLTYQQAMSSYGSDKPDLRCPATVRICIILQSYTKL